MYDSVCVCVIYVGHMSLLDFYCLCFPQNRVVRQNPGERNYHIFYALLAGTSAEQRGESGQFILSTDFCLKPLFNPCI